ncbi:hypothetical protein C7H19_13650 [Aphanothece hegewaldii CCALA 016]|uniref:Uncharacterized protein n=2 Tax=Aphanothece TaxID=1121 RepID=A0A2T1LWG4_9CHRO|nr:hypothetical protein C7H19_13650 [Aphanothece hegewaldii CCALA 016]
MLSREYFSINQFKSGIWWVGVPSCLFGTVERSVALFSDNYISVINIFHFLFTAFLFTCWIYLKPELKFDSNIKESNSMEKDDVLPLGDIHLQKAKTRMAELQQYHVIRQLYILPFSFICQIYHLLNLKHLETVHSLSLGNLKVIDVNGCYSTSTGGSLTFNTALSSPLSILKIWRQPTVQVELTLHTPYTVELSIPVYQDKKMIVLFNAFPLNSNKHIFLVNIYSNLQWPKFLLSSLLHIASFLTVYEDLPYLKKLSQRNLLKSNQTPSHQTMWLYKRFVELYASKLESKEEI